MTVKYFEGVRWGNVTLKTIQTRKKMEPGGQGIEPYWGGDFHHREWILVCDCGHEWTIEARKFPGRSQLRSCGQEECSVAKASPVVAEAPKATRGAGRPPLDGERRQIVPVNMPRSMHERAIRFAADSGLSVSRAFVLFISAGMAQHIPKEEEEPATTQVIPRPITRPLKPWQKEVPQQ